MWANVSNIIYDTNYTSIINGWGFVDHQFTQTTEKKAWFFDSLLKTQNTTPAQNQAVQNNWTQSQPQQKSPGFFDLLFWPLSNSKPAQNQAAQPSNDVNATA